MFTTLKRLQERDATEWRIDEREPLANDARGVLGLKPANLDSPWRGSPAVVGRRPTA
ncbi:hypothetical protein [Natrinema halophilum]|uniref:Uncharacterized protein n=1 Tax=Natrinema halophilum TaxID=1699371 RepID=A0A7D5K7D3_9EURY|nr:hypothetical protein [Natrinema halophilum]QLG49883.1 hypothetical protein HYG82_13970 [Natrinema halophilum]